MTAVYRAKTTWLLLVSAVSLSGSFAFTNLFEFVTIGILHQTGGYPFGGEGPTPWYYKSPQLYATVNLIFRLLFTSTLAVSCWAFTKQKTAGILISLTITVFLVFIELLNGLSA